jgi:hypothetical protein
MVQARSRALCFQAFFGVYRSNGGLNLDGASASGLYDPQAAGEAGEGELPMARVLRGGLLTRVHVDFADRAFALYCAHHDSLPTWESIAFVVPDKDMTI